MLKFGSSLRSGFGSYSLMPPTTGLSASETVVGIGPPLGVVGEYRCQPLSTVPVNLPRRCEPGAAAFRSRVSVHWTGSWAPNTETTLRKTAMKSRAILVRGGRRCRPAAQLALDPFINLAGGEFRRHANGVLHRIGIGAAMRDDTNSLDAQQRSSAVFRIIHPLLEVRERRSRQQVANLPGDSGSEGLLE